MAPALGSAGYARHQRITRPADFRRAFASGCRTAAGPLVLISVPNALDHARFGLAVSKRYVRHAVDRNRLKRLAREHFRAHAGDAEGRDLVLLIRAGTDTWDNARFRAALNALWGQHLRKCAASSSS
jgi:ribonuclease P protein component